MATSLVQKIKNLFSKNPTTNKSFIDEHKQIITIAAIGFVALGLLTFFILRSNGKRSLEYGFTDSPIAFSTISNSTIVKVEETNTSFNTHATDTIVEYSKSGKSEDGRVSILNVNTKNKPPLDISLVSDQDLETSSNNNSVSFDSNSSGFKIQYSTFDKYVKEEIILNNANSAKEFSFDLKTSDNVTLTKTSEGGITVEQDEIKLYYIYPLVAKDKNNKSIDYVYVIDGKKITVKPLYASQFNEAEYPITIDPTISWVFSTSLDYTVSDPLKIEIASGVVRLVNNSGSYADDNPYVINNKPIIYTTLSSFTEVLGGTNQGSVQYQISNNGTDWYWWNSAWTLTVADYSESNTASTISANISSFPSDIGTGGLQFKAFLHAPTTSNPVELDSVNVDFYSSTAPTISNVSPNSGPSVGETDVTITGTNFDTGIETKNYSFTGADQTYTVPAGVTSIRVKMWGGGGGGSSKGSWTYAYDGGGGGYTVADMAVTPGQVLTVMVGSGGAHGAAATNAYNYGGGGPNCAQSADCQYGGAGGGRSAIRVSGEDLLTAGGGGGAGSSLQNNNFETGGGGGGLTGQDGTATANSNLAGKGGSQVAGGIAGTGAEGIGSAGIKYFGGYLLTKSYGGGGGGGWYGGGSGSYAGINMGGGGGGSSYIGGAGVSNASTTAADKRTQANAGDWDNGGAGLGGLPYTAGQPGKVIIDVLPKSVTFGGTPARNIRVTNSTTMVVTIPQHSPGSVDVVVTNASGESATLTNGYTYNAPTVSSLTSNNGSTLGGEDVTITGTNFASGVNTKIYSYTGSDQTYTVPEGVTSIRVKLWGAGGGGGNIGGWTYGYAAGGGGYTTADIAVTPGEVLTVMVGQGGSTTANTNPSYGGGGPNCGGTDCQYAGQGGGRSAIRLNSEDLVTAGGGGGGGSTTTENYDENGGGGGGSTAQDGVSAANAAYAGKGGSQVAGGLAGSGSQVGATNGEKYIGGRPNAPYSYGGSGGGGWYGGGAGAYTNQSMGGGGGGSSYISGPGVSNGAMFGAFGRLQANSADVENGGAGLGGLSSVAGQHGKVIIDILPKSVTFGGVSATNVRFINSTTIIATTPSHTAGAVNVVVTNSDGQSATLTNGYTYNTPTVTSVTPNNGSTLGGTDVTITGTDFSSSLEAQTYNYTKADQTYVVPEGVTNIRIKMWGAGGAGGKVGSWGVGYPGGAGGYTTTDMPVTPGQVLTVMVGAGGKAAGTSSVAYGGGGATCTTEACVFGSQGGGRSAIRIAGEDIITAGGGGGGGSSRSVIARQNGGAGGGLVGQKGFSEEIPIAGGGGGTQSAGGAGGTSAQTGASGSKYNGASYPYTTTYGGSGGGGWYGGGTGSYSEPNTMGGGGGGSSYIGTMGLINPVAKRGNLNIQPNASDSDNGGAGAGGAPSTNGNEGKVIIYALPVKVTFAGVEATNVKYVNSTTITATTPANASGAVNVAITSPNGITTTLTSGFTYTGVGTSSVNPTSGSASGGTTITITGTNFANPEPTTFDFTNGDQTYTVPAGVTKLRVKMWGAGGGGGNVGGWTYGYSGGGGGYTSAELNVTPGDVLTVMVGQGGYAANLGAGGSMYGGGGAGCVGGDCRYSAPGGGRSAIRLAGEDILTAGGGGGGGATLNNADSEVGGGGGGIVAQDGNSYDTLTNGKGATVSTGGSGGIGFTPTHTAGYSGTNGTKYQGGTATLNSYGGGGGGGYYGGGGGAFFDNTLGRMGGGGGGSAFISGAGVINGYTLVAANSVQANSTDADNDGAGKGGVVSGTGRTGKVIIIPEPIKVEVGGISAKDVNYINSTTITAVVPANSAGAKDIKVTGSDGIISTLSSSFTYSGSSVTSITPETGSTAGGTNVTITGTGLQSQLSTKTFTYSGADQTYLVPDGVTTVYVKEWGGGGGGGDSLYWGYGYSGGGGGYTASEIAVTPGQVLTVMVGAGGVPGRTSNANNFYGGGGNNCNGDCNYAGQGGGRSAIRVSGEDILTAGGGGGGGTSRSAVYDQKGGAGGGATGQDGTSGEILTANGKGGTQVAGGANGTASGNGTPGTKYFGGNSYAAYGGSGGGGWYGGGPGAYQEPNTMGGGGGGSGYIGGAGLINPISLTGNLNVQANSGDSQNGGAGAGGAGTVAGTPGKVIITAAPIGVKFGTQRAANVTFVNDTTITATTTANTAGVKDVILLTPDGLESTLPNAFTFISPPTVTSIDPIYVVKTGGTSVTIHGSDFQVTPTVKFDGVNATSVTFIDSTTLTAVAPAHALGTVDVLVINPDGQEYTLEDGAIFAEAPPTVTSIDPSSGPTAGNTDVTITGSNFISGGVSTVLFGAVEATNVVFVNDTTITATTPANSGGLTNVIVKNSDAQIGTLTNGFRYFFDKFSIISTPISVRATEPGTLVVQAQDINGNPIILDTDVTLNLSSTSTSGFFAIDLNENESTRWDYNSVIIHSGTSNATFYYKDNEKGTPTITAAPDGSASLPATQVATIKSKFKLLITGVTSPIKLGVPSSVTVISVDYLGNPQHDYQGTVHFSSTDPATLLPSDFAYQLSMLGEHTFVNGVTMVTQGNFCVTATDVDDSDITGSQCAIEVTAPDEGTIAKLKILNGNQTIPLDGITTEITVQTQDTNGTGIPVQMTTPIYFYTDSVTGEFSVDGVTWANGPFTTAISAYATSKNFFYRDATLGAHHIVVRDDSVGNSNGTGVNVGWENDTATITTAVGSANKLALAGTPATLAAGVTSSAISISMQDVVGNNLTATQDKTVYLTSDNNNLQFSLDGTTGFATSLSTKIRTGDLTTVFYVKSTISGSSSVTVSDATPADGDTGLLDDTKSINITPASAQKLVLTSSPSEVIAGDVSELFNVQLQDQYNNPVNATGDFPVYLSASNTNALFSATSFGTTVTVINIPDGSNSVNFYLKQTKYFTTQTINVADTIGGVGAGGLVDTQTLVDILTGTVSQLGILESSPLSATAGVGTGPITAVTKNTFNVEVPIASDLTLYFYTNSVASTKEFSLLNDPSWNAITTHILPTGQSRFTFYYKDTKAATTTIKVSDDNNASFEFGLTNTTIDLNIVANSPDHLRITSSPNTADAGVATGAITTSLYDQYNNIAKSVSGTTINLASSSGTGRFDTSAVGAFDGSVTSFVIGADQTTNSFYYKDTVTGTPLITLSSSGLTGDSQTQTIQYGTVTSFEITSGQTSIVAGVSSTAITLRTYNAGHVNVPVPSAFAVNLTSANLTGRFDTSAVGAFNGGITTATVAMNQSSADFYYKDTKAGSVTITASKVSFSNSTKDFTITAASSNKLAFRDATLSDLNIGQKSAAIYIQSQDQFGNTTNVGADTTIFLHSNSSNYEFYNQSNVLASSVILSSGNFETPIYYKDFNTGTSTISLTDYPYPDEPNQGLENASKDINITYGAPAKLKLDKDNSDLQVGDARLVTLSLLNAYDQTVPAVGDTLINLSSTSLTGSFALTSNGTYNLTSVTVSNGNPSTTFYYKDTTTGSPTVSAIKVGLTTGTTTFNLVASGVFRLVFNSAPQTVEAGVSSGVYIIKFRDQFGNYTVPSTSLTIDLASTQLDATFANSNLGPWNVTSVDVNPGDNDARFYYKDTVSGTKTLTVSSGVLVNDTQNVTVTASTPTTMRFNPATPQTVAGQIASGTITVTLYDQYNNAAKPSSTVTLNLSSDSSQYEFSQTVTPWTPVTSVNIATNSTQAVFYYKDWIIGTPTITVSDNASIFDDINLGFTIIASNASKLLITTAPQSTFINTPTSNITFYVADNNDYKTQFNSDSIVHVTTDSVGGQFSIDNGQSWSSDITYNIGASTDTERSFIYVDSVEGNPTITIASAGLTSATQIESMITGTINKVVVTGDSTTVAGTPIALTIQTQNNSDVPVSVDADTILTLHSSSVTGEFSLTESPWTPITEFTLIKWQNQKVVYYKDISAGSATITVNAKVSQGWTDGVKLLNTNAASYYKIIFLTKPTSVIADEVSTVFVAQTVDQYGNLVGEGERTVYAYAPASGRLSLNNSTNFDTSTITLDFADGDFAKNFYYKDVLPGIKTVTASDQAPLDDPDTGIINATASVTILGQTVTGVRVTTSPFTGSSKATAGQVTGVITVEAYKGDNTSAIVGAPLIINLSTIPDAVGKFVLTPSASADATTTLTIPTGATSANIYYTSNIVGTYSMHFDSIGITGTTQNVEFKAAAPTHFTFLTAPQGSGAGIESTQFRVALEDAYENVAINATDLDIDLTTASATGKFSVQNGVDWADITQITLTAGTSDIYFYYKDSVAGTFQLKADENPDQGLTAATQNYIVTSGAAASIRFLSAPNTLQANQPSSAMSVSLYDVFGNPTTAQSDTTVYLYSNSGTGTFAASNLFSAPITSRLISTGSSTATFYYKDTASNSPVITVSDQTPLDIVDVGITNAVQTQTINWGAVTKLQFTNSNSSISASNIKSLQLKLLNAYDGIVQTPSQITVYLSTTSSGQFSLANTFNPGETITSYAIPASANGVDLYYKDTQAGSVTVTASDVSVVPEIPDTGITNATQTFSILPAALTNLVFVTSAQSLTVGQTSTVMSVQARDVYGNITSVDTTTPLYLYSTSGTAQFSASTDFSGGSLITQLSLNPGSSTVSFYYKDLTYVAPSSHPVIKVSNQTPNPGVDDAIIDATQTQTINAGNITQIVYSGSLGSTIAGTPASPITAIFKNQYNVEIPLTATKTLYFFSSLSGGSFASWNGSSCGTFGITQIDINAPNSRFTFCYKSTNSGTSTITVSDTSVVAPDTAWTNASAAITVDAGTITQIAYTNTSPISIIARHTSEELRIETRNQYGNPTNVATSKTIFLRSSSSTGEFALSPGGSWGINFATIPSGQNTVSAYYRDSTATVTPLTITAADNLPIIPDINLINGTLAVNISQQVVDNFLVTNISDPQIQGNSSSAVVIARDAENYTVDWYTGTIHFTSSDVGAVLPADYTFTTADKGLKTFTNGVAFASFGEHFVRVTDQGGITGVQNNITVNSSTAGPVTQVRFKDATNPTNVQKDVASVPITVQLRDNTGQGSNAGFGGFNIKVSSSSGTGQFSLSPTGPFTSSGVFTVPQSFNAINVYYKESTAGNFTLTANDWISNVDDVGISNDTLGVVVNTLLINVTPTLEVSNNNNNYVTSPIIFAKNDSGGYTARASFVVTTTDAISGAAKLANLTFNWKNPAGTIIQNDSVSNVSSHQFDVASITGNAQSANYTLEITGESADASFTNTSSTSIPISGWVANVSYDPSNINLGQPISFTIETRNNGTLADSLNLSVNIRDNTGADVVGSQYIKQLSDLAHNGTGLYSGTLPSLGLSTSTTYYLYARIYDNSNVTQAEDNHDSITLQNNPALAPKNLIIEKIATSTAPATETYDLKFSWDLSQYGLNYNLYRSTNKTNTLYSDTCTLDDIKFSHRFGDVGSVAPFCETDVQQNINLDDSTSWVKMATINTPTNSYTIPWSTINSTLTDGTYYYVLRAENAAGESAYSTMVFSSKRNYNFNAALANTNWISIPYNSRYTKASDIVTEIEGGTGNDTNHKINTITLWKSNSQDVESYKYNPILHKWVGTDFTINVGDGISLILSGRTSNFDWTIAGSDIVNAKTLNLNAGIPNNNWLSIPYSTKFLSVSDIVKDIEGGVGSATNQKIKSISVWDASTQSKNTYNFDNGLDSWTGSDFAINPGDGISIELSGGSSSVIWTPYLIINPNN